MIYSNLSKISVFSALGMGSTNTRIRSFSIVEENVGAAISLVQSTANGDSFTINKNGIYFASYTDVHGAIDAIIGISRNATGLSSDISNSIDSNILTIASDACNIESFCQWIGFLKSGDIIRAHTSFQGGSSSNGNTGAGGVTQIKFQIMNVL